MRYKSMLMAALTICAVSALGVAATANTESIVKESSLNGQREAGGGISKLVSADSNSAEAARASAVDRPGKEVAALTEWTVESSAIGPQRSSSQERGEVELSTLTYMDGGDTGGTTSPNQTSAQEKGAPTTQDDLEKVTKPDWGVIEGSSNANKQGGSIERKETSSNEDETELAIGESDRESYLVMSADAELRISSPSTSGPSQDRIGAAPAANTESAPDDKIASRWAREAQRGGERTPSSGASKHDS